MRRAGRIIRQYTQKAPGQVPQIAGSGRVQCFEFFTLGVEPVSTRKSRCSPIRRDVDLDLVPPRELAHQNLLRQRILDELLDRPLERPRAILLVVAVLHQEVGRRLGEAERELLLRQPLANVLEQHADDLRDVLAAERMEDDDVVETVQELRVEHVLQLVPHLLRAPLPVRLVVAAT